MHVPVAPITVTVYGCALLTNVIREHIASERVSRSALPPWEEIVRRMQYVKTPELRQMANSITRDPPGLAYPGVDGLAAIGGLDGLRRLQQNGIVLAALASRIENFVVLDDPGLVEEIKKSALQLRRRVLLIVAVRQCRFCDRLIKKWLKDVANLYCRMVSVLIYLYTSSHQSRVQRLIVACDW